MNESIVKKGGVHSDPTTKKPDIKPKAQTKFYEKQKSLCNTYCPLMSARDHSGEIHSKQCMGDECSFWVHEKEAPEGVCGIRAMIFATTKIEEE